MKMNGFGAGIIPSVCFSGALSSHQAEISLIFSVSVLLLTILGTVLSVFSNQKL